MDSKKQNQKQKVSASQAIKTMQEFCRTLGINLIHEQPKEKTASIRFIGKNKGNQKEE